MVSFQQSFATCVGILTILSYCQCSELSNADELLQKRENSKLGVKTLAALLRSGLLSEEKDKRVFCNDFFGCSNGKKRSDSMNLTPLNYPFDAELETKTDFRELLSEEKDHTQKDKRVFCNGFFGCSNGYDKKRSDTMNLTPLDYPFDAPEPETKTDFRELLSEEKDHTQKDKRVFCDSIFGCSSGKKRSASMNLTPLDYPFDAPEPETKTYFRERLFCKQGSCFGRQKRSTSQTLERRLNNRGHMDGNQ